MSRAAAILALGLVAVPAAAQRAGVVVGTVRDTSGAGISGARITAGDAFTLSGPDGRYRLPNVRAGTVWIRARAFTFSPDSALLTVPPGDSVRWDVTLRAGAISMPVVVVTAGKRPESLENVSASVAVLSDTVVARHAVNTIDEAVDRAPGVQFLNGQVNIRGSSGYVQGLGARVLLLVDGVPMNEGDRGGIDWDLVPVDDVERIEVVKGAGSSLYGSSAFGGVVNLITRDIPEGVHGRVRFFGGGFANPPDSIWRFRNYTGLQGGGDVTGSFGTDQFRGALTVGGRHSDGYRQQDESDAYEVAGKGEWLPDPVTHVLVSGTWDSHQYQVPLIWCVRGQCDDKGQSFQPFLIDTTGLGSHTRSDHGYLSATITRTPEDNLTWMGRVSWLRTHFTDFQPGNNDFAIADRFGAEGRVVVEPTPDQTVTVGGEITESQVTSDIFHNHTQELFAGYGETERVVGQARFTAGARIDLLAVDGAGLSAVVSPRLGGVLSTDLGVWRASVGKGFRAPSLGEQYVTTVVSPFTVVPNPGLVPETGWNFELGNAAAVTSWLRTDAALFLTEASDLIEPEVAGNGLEIQFQNVQRARLAGLDLSVAADPVRHLTTTLSYTYLDAQQLAADGLPQQPLAFRPRHLLTLSADYTLGPASVGADFRYSSRFDRVELYETDPRVGAKVLDLRAGWRAGPVEVRILATNALNYIYNLVPRTLEPVATVTMTVTYVY
ncbi:MAG TPA: TonB-dependent receptor [Gemmatimonadales bacterium]|nr:TonB-dependent receptor [Gemmatimonadales bacterium]